MVPQRWKVGNRALRSRNTVPSYERKDATYRAAKQAGLRSRAGVKLEDLDARFRFLAPGKVVVDLGSWPGAWLQVAAERVGSEGQVIGVDLVEVEPLGRPNVSLLRGDASDLEIRHRLRTLAGSRADVVLSDMAPKLTGVRATDAAREEALVELAIDIAGDILKPGGALLVKLFSRVEAPMVALLRRRFVRVATYRPPSTRRGSSEIYAFAAGPR